MLWAALLVACGSHVTTSGAGGSAAAGASSGTAAAGGGCEDTTMPCQRAAAGDQHCTGQGGGSLNFVCYGMRAVSSACSYPIVCDACFWWCCPPEPWSGPTYAELDSGAGGDGPAPPGCARQPADDYGCRAQLKPPLAVYCPELDFHSMPPGCAGNSYGADSCRGAAEGYFCCPAP